MKDVYYIRLVSIWIEVNPIVKIENSKICTNTCILNLIVVIN